MKRFDEKDAQAMSVALEKKYRAMLSEHARLQSRYERRFVSILLTMLLCCCLVTLSIVAMPWEVSTKTLSISGALFVFFLLAERSIAHVQKKDARLLDRVRGFLRQKGCRLTASRG